MYGTNISVKLSSAWEDVQLESEYAIDQMKAEAEVEDVQSSGPEKKEGDEDGDNPADNSE